MQLRRSDLEIEVLYNRIHRGDLDLQPNYQRGEVWNMARRQRLVDTILRGWYIPAIHIVRDKSGREAVLDGQQRLQTIRSFMDNEFKFSGKIDPLREDLDTLAGLFYRDLPEVSRRDFERFEITVVTLTDFNPTEPSELFFRLNQQYTLTPSEKRNALFGKARDQVKIAVDTLMGSGLLHKSALGFSNGRLAYDDIIARVFLTFQEGTLRRQLSNSYIEDFYRAGEFEEFVIQRTISAGEALARSLPGSRSMRFNKATLYSWMIFTDHLLRVSNNGPSGEFIYNFEALQNQHSHQDSTWNDRLPGAHLYGVVRAYSDRSSYRVLDVNSVLIRDFALHVLHTDITGQSYGDFRVEQSINALSGEDDAEHLMLDMVRRLDWGANL